MFKHCLTHKNETWKHYIVKCILFKLLKDLGHEVYVEFETVSGVIDVLDKTTGLAYEVDGSWTDKKIREKTSLYTKYVGVKDMIPIDYNIYFSNELDTIIRRLQTRIS